MKSKTQRDNFTDLEYEILFLKMIAEMIDSMVNHEVLDITGPTEDTTVYFKTEIHQKHFYILLVDCISQNNSLMGGLSGINLLEKICQSPLLNNKSAASGLSGVLSTFNCWLDEKVVLKDLWFPDIDKKCSLTLKRRDFIYICGNISKHSFARLTIVSEKIHKIFSDSGLEIYDYDEILVLNNFYENIHDNILIYLASSIVEMLNDIRWEVRDYLLPTTKDAYKKIDGEKHTYIIPKDLKTEFTRQSYWYLLDSAWDDPYVKRFKATKYLKRCY